MLYYFTFTTEEPIRTFKSIWVSVRVTVKKIQKEFEKFSDDDERTAARTAHSDRFDKKSTSEFVAEI